ncbi:hypothetical protein [Asticcacaulis sp. AND118]|uniref:hypothetical protein n=1 Tax=Asticcacaulis sp. AND118 TaxID=2840468 RepID=UPI001CFFC906|nr:hypothetical protein [Asticcacaulis sp. AND118]UDF03112.1 hypothetical protein LH365_11820 [Asticcacaulis sp. AND118]
MDAFELKLCRLCISEDHQERNTLAIDLLDAALTAPEKSTVLLPALFKAITVHDFQQIGTLVWCAGHFDCSAYLAELHEIVLRGSFEASETAKQILADLSIS